jgi:hypothetical protein
MMRATKSDVRRFSPENRETSGQNPYGNECGEIIFKNAISAGAYIYGLIEEQNAKIID